MLKDYNKIQNTKLDISKAKPLSAYMVFNNLPSIHYYIKSFTMPGCNLGYTTLPFKRNTNFYIPSNKSEVQEISISFFADEYLINYFAIVEWLNELQSKHDFTDLVTDASITVLDNSKSPIIKIELLDCFPTSIDGVDFSMEMTEPMTPFLTIKANRYKWEYLEYDVKGIFGTDEKFLS